MPQLAIVGGLQSIHFSNLFFRAQKVRTHKSLLECGFLSRVSGSPNNRHKGSLFSPMLRIRFSTHPVLIYKYTGPNTMNEGPDLNILLRAQIYYDPFYV